MMADIDIYCESGCAFDTKTLKVIVRLIQGLSVWLC